MANPRHVELLKKLWATGWQKHNRVTMHHCVSLDCLRQIMERLGYVMDAELSFENSRGAYCLSVCHKAMVSLNKQTDVMDIDLPKYSCAGLSQMERLTE